MVFHESKNRRITTFANITLQKELSFNESQKMTWKMEDDL